MFEKPKLRIKSWAAVVFLAILGCGSGRGDLHGTISYKGKLLTTGSVQVVGSDGIPKGAEIQSDGSYQVRDILAGEVKIAVNSPDPGKVKFIPRKKNEAPPPKADRTGWFSIPEHYGD